MIKKQKFIDVMCDMPSNILSLLDSPDLTVVVERTKENY